MDKKQTEKSQAELYREERKQRMAKAAKKNATKSPQLAHIGNVVGKVIGIIIVVALCLGAVYGCLSFFGVPQKVLTAAKIGNEKVSVAKYNFYYYDIYTQTYSQAYQYENYYGAGKGLAYTGYDVSKTPYEQDYTLGTIEGYDKPTWADYFEFTTLNYLQSYVSYAKLAKEEGVTVTEDQKKEIEEQVDSIKKSAESNDFSLNRYLTKIYGKGVNEKLLREVFEERYLAYNYANAKQEEFAKNVTDDEINAEFNDNIQSYTTFDVSLFEVTATAKIEDGATDEQKAEAQSAAMSEAKASAEGYLAKVTDPASVLAVARTYKATLKDETVNLKGTSADEITSTYGEKVTEWIFADGRAVNDKAVIEVDGGYVVISISSLPARETRKAVDVRHILVQFDTKTDSDGNATSLTDAQKKSYYDSAKEILDKYLENPTEENFAALATEKSEDTGSKENGGLYEDVAPGDMVTEFNDWIFDPARVPGDTGIVETKIGYHVMYYVGNDNPEIWQINCRTNIANSKYNKFDKDLSDSEENAINKNNVILNWALSLVEDTIKTSFANKAASK